MQRSQTIFAMALLLVSTPLIAQESITQFYRAINLNGPALMIDGQQWESGEAPNLNVEGMAFENQSVSLQSKTDSNRTKMIRSSRWGQKFSAELINVPPGTYQVFAYVWEDNDPEKYSIELNGKTVVAQFNSGTRGQWKRLGPWKSTSKDGSLRLSATGGAANFSGIEVWSGVGQVPDVNVTQFASSPTEEQLHYFESRIRPLLIDNCYACHSQDAEEIGGNLLLDSRAGIVKGGATGSLMVPGDPDNSLLMRAVDYKDADLKMPPDAKLSDDQIADLAEWIRIRAPDPRSEDTVAAAKAKTEIDWTKARDFWSLQPVSYSEPPAVKNGEWPWNPIDQFVAAKFEAAGLSPTSDADKRTLIRRATFDLIGLPPTLDEVDDFLADQSPEAFAQVVDRLLESPRYGERWGRHWLDVVRYADTAGDNSDFPIPQIHRYRDWVIDAFNSDLPYDAFVRDQLAGDLLGGKTEKKRIDRLIATGYIANARRFGSRVNDYPQHLTIEDTIDNLGRTFLGLTISCARCHDHKFDPITNRDYYALFGIFHSTRYPWPGIELDQQQRDFVPIVATEKRAELEKAVVSRNKEQSRLDDEVKRLKQSLNEAKDADKQDAERKLKQAEHAAKEFRERPPLFETAYAVSDDKPHEDVAVQLKGDPAHPGDVVPRHFLTVLGGQELPPELDASGREQLAEWILADDNPLTSRVIANRIWQYHFGRGIVPTPNDFGKQGKPPTHPELLDYLAIQLRSNSWSIKSMHRMIMLSRTYQQSSSRDPQAIAQDPGDEWLAGYPRRRLDAEAIRDTLLVLGGSLELSPAGPHPFPPPHERKFTQHNPFKAVYETNHRSVFLMTQRIQRHPFLAIFDGADPSTSTAARMSTTTPVQALYLLNDSFVHEQAARVVDRIKTEKGDASRIELVYHLLFARPPVSDEVSSAIAFLNNARTLLSENGVARDQIDTEAWQACMRSLFRLNEFLYLD